MLKWNVMATVGIAALLVAATATQAQAQTPEAQVRAHMLWNRPAPLAPADAMAIFRAATADVDMTGAVWADEQSWRDKLVNDRPPQSAGSMTPWPWPHEGFGPIAPLGAPFLLRGHGGGGTDSRSTSTRQTVGGVTTTHTHSTSRRQ